MTDNVWEPRTELIHSVRREAVRGRYGETACGRTFTTPGFSNMISYTHAFHETDCSTTCLECIVAEVPS